LTCSLKTLPVVIGVLSFLGFGSARRWISTVNNWGKLGKWDLHVCRYPQMLERDLEDVIKSNEESRLACPQFPHIDDTTQLAAAVAVGK